jgi:predicted transcriptional regulator of viral defense system
MPGRMYVRLYEIAQDHLGYVTLDQAQKSGASRAVIAMMARRGTLERVSYGVYKVTAIPGGPLGPYMEAGLWPYPERGVLSHETALELLGVSDVNPAKIHVSVPIKFRSRRKVPSEYVLHRMQLPTDQIDRVEGIPVTTAARAIRDCAATHLGSDLLEQAITQSFHKGRLTEEEMRALVEEVLTARNLPSNAAC